MICVQLNGHTSATIRVVTFALATIVIGETCIGDNQADIEFFEKQIRPVLVQSCYRCHSGQADEIKGGLRLDSREAMRSGGESGPAVLPGKPDESLLIQALKYESFEMPPKNQLPSEIIQHFVAWVANGAVDPRDKPDSASQTDLWSTTLESRREWWSLRPVQNPPIPKTDSHWPRQSIDHFILAKLDAANLRPVDVASPRQLIRRLSIVLTGLPPDPEDIDRFLDESDRDTDAAYNALVDQLLDSPQFGERWARHWMDVVRFTETHGNEWNYEVHHAWRYRDYLIRAFNADLPYDLFVREHIAGDLMKLPRWNDKDQINESLIGTSFYRFGEASHDDCVSLTSIGYDILDNQIDSLSKAFQATTVACARCHNHKIDAVSMEDYYALLGILKSSHLTAHTLDAASVNAESLTRLRQLKAEIKSEVVRYWNSQMVDLDSYLLSADASIRSTDAKDSSTTLAANRIKRWKKALNVNDPSMDHPMWVWRQLDDSDINTSWNKARVQLLTEHQDNAEFNQTRFTSFADFRNHVADDWSATGQGLRSMETFCGDMTIASEGDSVIDSILPAGCFTHRLSQKLNGTLRSPTMPDGATYISAQLIGDKTSAFRLVSNNCQLNYINYKALTSSKPTWITFEVPGNAESLNTFAELITKFNNPKFPDQLGTLGGDRTNDRIPWEKAATDPRSYFGIMRVVLHQQPEPPKPDLSAAQRLFENAEVVRTRAHVAKQYADAIRSAFAAWKSDGATDDDVYWLSWVVENRLLDDKTDATPTITRLVKEYRSIEQNEIQRPRLAAGIADFGTGRDHPILLRGNYATPGDPVPRRYLEVLSKDGVKGRFDEAGSGRRQLADLIASPENPLTSRVFVNRVWHHLFGTGIVKTVDDFGQVGDLPSHPKLLDHLASRFSVPGSEGGMGWSPKSLIREIVLSTTFRQSNRPRDSNSKTIDPQNRLLHHYPARRMEAEAIRDSILAVSGRLDRKQYGLSIQPYRQETNDTRRLFAGPLDGNGRRSVYIKINLMEGPKFLGSFDLPGGKVTQGKRDVTNVPAQALTLLNDDFVLQQAGVWAEQLVGDGSKSVADRLNKMFNEALGRPISPAEHERFENLVKSMTILHKTQTDKIMANKDVWKDVAHVMFNLKEFIYIP